MYILIVFLYNYRQVIDKSVAVTSEIKHGGF